MTLRICKNPTCERASQPQPLDNFPISQGDSRRRICRVCYQIAERERKRRHRASDKGDFIHLYGKWGCNETCPEWDRCKGENLAHSDEPLPCEQLLDEEVGYEYESGEMSLWVMPPRVSFRVDMVSDRGK